MLEVSHSITLQGFRCQEWKPPYWKRTSLQNNKDVKIIILLDQHNKVYVHVHNEAPL